MSDTHTDIARVSIARPNDDGSTATITLSLVIDNGQGMSAHAMLDALTMGALTSMDREGAWR